MKIEDVKPKMSRVGKTTANFGETDTTYSDSEVTYSSLLQIYGGQDTVFDEGPRNWGVSEEKTKNKIILDDKTKTKVVLDSKPNNKVILIQERERYYDVVLGANMPMGLLLSLTYPTEITVQSSFSP